MEKKIVREIFHGVLSLSILIIITSLYFLSSSGIEATSFEEVSTRIKFNPIDSITGYYLIKSMNLGNSSCTFDPPTEDSIIIRLDDVQAFKWNEVSVNLTETILERNMFVTLGVIPKDIDKDPVVKNYILSKVDDDRIEIAQHGTNHDPDEYLGLNEEESYKLARQGWEKLVRVFRKKIATFIPPYGSYNENITAALSRLDFVVVSGRQNEYMFNNNMVYLGYTVPTKFHSSDDLTPNEVIIDQCRNSLDENNICVIVVHPSDFADEMEIDEEKYEQFVKLLESLKTLGAESITFNDLVHC